MGAGRRYKILVEVALTKSSLKNRGVKPGLSAQHRSRLKTADRKLFLDKQLAARVSAPNPSQLIRIKPRMRARSLARACPFFSRTANTLLNGIRERERAFIDPGCHVFQHIGLRLLRASCFARVNYTKVKRPARAFLAPSAPWRLYYIARAETSRQLQRRV
jgi:hypothetical protein